MHTRKKNAVQGSLFYRGYFQKSPGFSRTPEHFFQDVVAAQQYLNVKINGSYLLKIYKVALQSTKVEAKGRGGEVLGRVANPPPTS